MVYLDTIFLIKSFAVKFKKKFSFAKHYEHQWDNCRASVSKTNNTNLVPLVVPHLHHCINIAIQLKIWFNYFCTF